MTGYVADLSRKSGARAIEKLDRLRSTMAVNVLSSNSWQMMMIPSPFVLSFTLFPPFLLY